MNIEFTRLNNDVNGNPRYAVHFLNFINDADEAKAKELSKTVKPFSFPLSHLYNIAVAKANTIGGRRYHNKKYGGGIVFQSYNNYDLEELITNLKNN